MRKQYSFSLDPSTMKLIDQLRKKCLPRQNRSQFVERNIWTLFNDEKKEKKEVKKDLILT